MAFYPTECSVLLKPSKGLPFITKFESMRKKTVGRD